MNPLEIARSPGFQQALVLAVALCGGLWLMTVAARTSPRATGRARPCRVPHRYRGYATGAAWRGHHAAPAGPAQPAGVGRAPLAAPGGQPWSIAAPVGLAVLLAAAGCVLVVMSGLPALALAPVIGFLLPFVRQRSAAEKVRRRVQSNLPDLSAMLAAEMAAAIRPIAPGAPPPTGRPLAHPEDRLGGAAHVGPAALRRVQVPGLLLDVADRYDLPALRRSWRRSTWRPAPARRTGADVGPGPHPDRRVQDRALREAEALDSRLAVPSVGFFFMPFLFLVFVPLLLPVLNAL